MSSLVLRIIELSRHDASASRLSSLSFHQPGESYGLTPTNTACAATSLILLLKGVAEIHHLLSDRSPISKAALAHFGVLRCSPFLIMWDSSRTVLPHRFALSSPVPMIAYVVMTKSYSWNLLSRLLRFGPW